MKTGVMRPRNRALRLELAKAAIAGTARFVCSRGMVGANDYEIDREALKDMAIKAVAIADAMLDALEQKAKKSG